MAGDPDIETTRLLVETLTQAGADAIELGIPFGDPLADGPTIAQAGARALRNGMTIASVLGLVRNVAPAAAPIVLFTYFNPLERYGIERFARDAAAAGASGAIVPDITLEESGAVRAALLANGLSMPLLVAPSTPPERARQIAASSTGFVYVVSRLGVTGAPSVPDFDPLRRQIAMLRSVTGKPLAVGFGISRSEHVARVRDVVDGVIVGSAILDAYAGTAGMQAAAQVRAFTRELTEGI